MKKILAQPFLYVIIYLLGKSVGAPAYISFFGSLIYVQLVFLAITAKENGP